MALVLPTPQELLEYKEDVSGADALQQAGDLFTLATGIRDTPTDEFEARLTRTAILEMAWYLQSAFEEKDSVFSAFSSERIGSYSYQKMTKSVSDGEKTNVAGFDRAVEYFLGLAMGTAGGISNTTSEWVFKPGYQGEQPTITHPDSSYTYTPTYTPPADPPPVTTPEPGEIVFDDDGFPEVVG